MAQPEMATLSKMPEEILEMIFSYIDQPKDLMTVSRTTSQFSRILSRTAPVWHFPQAFPLVFPELDRDDILNCRLVCKGWKKSVDSFLEAHPVLRELEPYPYHPTKTSENMIVPLPSPLSYSLQYHPCLIQKGLEGLCLTSVSLIATLMADMQDHPGNPFFMRFLNLANDPSMDHELEEYWSHAFQLLSLFGEHIWQLHIGPNGMGNNRDVLLFCYQTVRQVLQYTPNLRVLTVCGFACHRSVHPEDFEHYSELVSYIGANPLPELPHLHTIESTIPDSFKTQPIIDEMMSRYSHGVRKIYLLSSMWKRDKDTYLRLPNLSEMQIGINETDLECVRLFGLIDAPQLEKLFVIIWRPVEFIQLLECLRENFQSLRYLKLKFNCRPTDFRSRFSLPKFALKHIKTLEIFESNEVPYDILLSHLPALEYILVCAERQEPEEEKHEDEEDEDVEDEDEEDEDEEDEDEEDEDEEDEDEENEGDTEPEPCDGRFEIRQFMNSGTIMYKSNVWTLLKSLKEFTFGWIGSQYSNTRDEIVNKSQFTRDKLTYLRKK